MKYFLIGGEQIRTSFSPQIHSQIYDFLGVEAEYSLMPLKNIADFGAIKLDGVGGFNVTTPFKSAIIPYISRDLSDCGSINTLKLGKNREIFGFSTDGKGFILDARRLNLDLSVVLLLGFGGAAKSIAHELEQIGSKVIVQKRGETVREKVTLTVNCTGENLACDYDLRYKNCGENARFDGLGMLIYQAILSCEIFFDHPIKPEIFDKIYKKLKG